MSNMFSYPLPDRQIQQLKVAKRIGSNGRNEGVLNMVQTSEKVRRRGELLNKNQKKILDRVGLDR
jgi:hypothetical protein